MKPVKVDVGIPDEILIPKPLIERLKKAGKQTGYDPNTIVVMALDSWMRFNAIH